jgi:hypothetical protein
MRQRAGEFPAAPTPSNSGAKGDAQTTVPPSSTPIVVARQRTRVVLIRASVTSLFLTRRFLELGDVGLSVQ